jgi:uncharacterized protein YxeA
MKKILIGLTLLASMSSFAAEYTIKVNNTDMFKFYGSISGEVLNSEHPLHMNKKAIVSASTAEVYEQLQNVSKGATITVKGSSDLKDKDSYVKLNAISVSE